MAGSVVTGFDTGGQNPGHASVERAADAKPVQVRVAITAQECLLGILAGNGGCTQAMFGKMLQGRAQFDLRGGIAVVVGSATNDLDAAGWIDQRGERSAGSGEVDRHDKPWLSATGAPTNPQGAKGSCGTMVAKT